MNDIRKTSGTNWTACPNHIIRDFELTPNAFRVLMVIHSFADDFQFASTYVQHCAGIGRDAYRAAIMLLEERGLLTCTKYQASNGQWRYDYHVFPKPGPENPALVHPALVHPATAQPALENKALLEDHSKKTIKEEKEKKTNEVPSSSSSKDLSMVGNHVGGELPYDQWVSDEFSRFGYHLPIPVSQNIAARTLTAMSREYGEQYITDRLSELTGRPQAAVVKYILQDGAGWLQRKLNPPPAREQRARANRREIYRDPQFVGKPFPVATTDADLDEMFGPDPSKAKP